MAKFFIQQKEFEYEALTSFETIEIKSMPRNYDVRFISNCGINETILREISESNDPVVICDQSVITENNIDTAQWDVSVLIVDAKESFKTLEGAERVINFLIENRIGRGSTVIVIGGGIVQDVCAFACGTFKRGVPWTYIPTTLLAQTDSCIGAKSGLNFKGTKNLVGMFSAPRRVLINPEFLSSLPKAAIESGLGEAFRLSIIGGKESLEIFTKNVFRALDEDYKSLLLITKLALTIKRAVIEIDEFELDLRRSMNYGHSLGHAIEALTNYAIPHGTAVVLGLLTENQISREEGLLSADECELIEGLGIQLVGQFARDKINSIELDGVLDLLFKDKKTEAGILKLVVPEKIGSIKFIDLPLTQEAMPLIRRSFANVLKHLN